MQQKNVLGLLNWSCSSVFLGLSAYYVSDMFYSDKHFTRHLTLSGLHEFFPLLVSSILLVSYFLVVSHRGYIETFFDVEGNHVDEEELMREVKVVKVKKVFYVRYLSLLFAWPVLIALISKDTVLSLIHSALYSVGIVVAIELLISVMLICSFKSQWQKLIASFPLIFLQVFVLVIMCMHKPELVDKPLLFLFYFSWVGYTMTWVCGEVLEAISETSRDMVWSVLDLIQFALIPTLIQLGF